MKKKINDFSCKMLSQISIRHTLDHLSKQFYYLAKLFLVFTKKQQHVFIIKAIINYPKRSKAILGVEMTNMGQTANFWGEINAAPLGAIFYKSDVNRFQYIWTLPVREDQDHRRRLVTLISFDAYWHTNQQDYSLV